MNILKILDIVSDKKLDGELKKILKPLRYVQIDFEADHIVLRLIYSRNKKSTAAVITYRLEEGDTMETIFDGMRPRIINEYIETNWSSK